MPSDGLSVQCNLLLNKPAHTIAYLMPEMSKPAEGGSAKSAELARDDPEVDSEESLLYGQYYPQARFIRRNRICKLEHLSNAVLILSKLVFYISAIACFWVYISTATNKHKQDARTPVLYTGFGEGNYGLAEDIAGQIPICEFLPKYAILLD